MLSDLFESALLSNYLGFLLFLTKVLHENKIHFTKYQFLIALSHDIDDQCRPTSERMAPRASAGSVLVMLPKEARLCVLAQHGAQNVLSQRGVEAQGACLEYALEVRVVVQGTDGQVVDRHPNRAPAARLQGKEKEK